MPLIVKIGLLFGVGAGLTALAARSARRVRSTPEKRESLRLHALHASGRIADALLTEVEDDTLYFTYEVRGVQYAASQNVDGLRHLLPANLERLIGMASMKYSVANPADSILICEEWSGLRELPRDAAPPSITRRVSADGDRVGHQAQDSALAQGS